jgi:hypothetical protein
MNFWPAAVTLISTVIGGMITAYFSVRLALKKFRTERWWEKKAETYTSAIEALFDIRAYSSETSDRLEVGRSLDDDRMQQLAKRSAAGRGELRRIAALGNLVVSKDCATRLDLLITELDDPLYNRDLYEIASDTADISSKAITDLRELARADLRLR